MGTGNHTVVETQAQGMAPAVGSAMAVLDGTSPPHPLVEGPQQVCLQFGSGVSRNPSAPPRRSQSYWAVVSQGPIILLVGSLSQQNQSSVMQRQITIYWGPGPTPQLKPPTCTLSLNSRFCP